jgi:hypothetical protein
MREIRARWMVSVLLLAPHVASADVAPRPPDPSSIEAHCTEVEQCPNGKWCNSLPPRKVDGPLKELFEKEQKDCAGDLEQRCFDAKQGVLYCPKGATGTWSPPTPPKKHGCLK